MGILSGIDSKGLTGKCNDYTFGGSMLTPGIPTIVRERFPQVVKEYEALIMDDHAALLDITFKGNELLTVTIHHYLTCKACLKIKGEV